MLRTLRHLLPDSTAWRLVVERTLKKYLRGVAVVGSDTVKFVDDVYDDLWPDLTRELSEWLNQFGIESRPWSNDDDMRAYLDFRWGEDRSTSPKSLQGKLQAAGFDAYVYDSFDMLDLELTTYTEDVSPALTQISANGTGFDFALNGLRLYVADHGDNEIHQYSLSTGYGLSSVVYDSLSFDASTWADVTDVFITPDGTKMMVLNDDEDDISEFDLGTLFDVSSAVYSQTSLDMTTYQDSPGAFHWSGDGTRVFVIGTTGTNVDAYTMSAAWDVSTLSYTNSYDHGVVTALCVTFTSDGTVMLIADSTGSTDQFNLGTAWDLTTVSTTSNTMDLVPPVDTSIRGLRLYGNKLVGLSSIASPTLHRFRYGAWRDPLDYATQPKAGTVQCGDDGSAQNPVAECGEVPPDQVSLDSAVCNNFLANEVWYLVNDTLTDDAPPPIPTDSAQWGPFWYVGGAPIGTELEVDEYDRQRFEKLCLKHGPAEAWIVTIIDIWQTNLLGTWAYEDTGETLDTGEWQFTVTTTTPVKIHDTDDDGTDQSTPLSGIASGDKLRFVRDDDTWIEYVTTGAASDQTTYWAVAINTTPTEQSSDWAGFPSAGGLMQIHHRESV